MLVPRTREETSEDYEVYLRRINGQPAFLTPLTVLTDEEQSERDDVKSEVLGRQPKGWRFATAGFLLVAGFFGVLTLASLVAQHGFEWHQLIAGAIKEYRETLYPLYNATLGKALDAIGIRLTNGLRDTVTLCCLGFGAANAESVLRSGKTLWAAIGDYIPYFEAEKEARRGGPKVDWRDSYKFVVKHHVLSWSAAVGMGLAALAATAIGVWSFFAILGWSFSALRTGTAFGYAIPSWVVAAPFKFLGPSLIIFALGFAIFAFRTARSGDHVMSPASLVRDPLAYLWAIGSLGLAPIVLLGWLSVCAAMFIGFVVTPLLFPFCAILSAPLVAWRTSLVTIAVFGFVLVSNVLWIEGNATALGRQQVFSPPEAASSARQS